MKKLKIRFKKAIILVTVILNILPFLFVPFTVYSETVSGDSPIIGVNVSITDHDHDTYNNTGTITLTSDMTRWQCEYTNNGACQLWTSKNSGGSTNDSIDGSIVMPVYQTDAYIYTYDFVLDGEYVGYITFTNSFGATGSKTYYVNGSHLIISSTVGVFNFSVSSYSLSRIDSNNIMWMFPIESFNLIYSMIENDIEMAEFYQYANYTFPFFNLKTNNVLGTFYWYQDIPNRFIYFCKNYTITETQFPLYFSVPDGVSFHDAGVLNYVRIGSTTYYLAWVETIQSSSASIRGNLKYVNSETLHFMPIFFGPMHKEFISTDFALNFGLSNRLLDDLDIIANGTISSNTSSNDLNDKKDDVDSAMNDVFDMEDDFNNDLNSSLNDIDTDFDIGNTFGSKFMYSAEWVRSQFTNLTNNNPFGTLLSFSLLLGLALLLVGKVFG